MLRTVAFACLALAGCESCGTDGVHHLPDAPPPPDAPLDAFTGPHTGGVIVVTESPAGSAPQNAWGGVLGYKFATTGGAETAITGIDKSLVRDPVSVVLRPGTTEILVSDRHGNAAADGVAGSLSRFRYDPATQAFTASGTITGASLIAPHQAAFDPTTGELFVATKDNGVARFTFSGDTATEGTPLAIGPTRGIAIAPDGKRLYVTTASNVIRQFVLPAGTEVAPITVPVAANFHFCAFRAGQLYVAGLDVAKIYRYRIEADDSLTEVAQIDTVPNPAGLGFSEDGLEMFVPGHRTTTQIGRLRYEAASDTWTPTTEISVAGSLGGIAILPIR